jgi:hypothetical protein
VAPLDDPPWWNRRYEALLYLVAGLSYCGFAIFHKFLLNWIIGPIWLVAWVVIVPLVIERVRGRRRPTGQ